MCFNAALVQTAEILEELYGAAFPAESFPAPAWFVSAFEHPVWPVLKQGQPEAFASPLWGLVPSWVKDSDKAADIRNKTINARFETIAEKPSFRSLVNRRRCGVVVDGFVEWRSYGGKKYPYHIALPEKRPFLLGGLWDRWKDPGSDTGVETFTVVTVDAEGILSEIHNTKKRMPLVLSKEDGPRWLDPEIPFSELSETVVPFYRGLEAWTIPRDVSMPRTEKNHREIQEPFDYPELPALSA